MTKETNDLAIAKAFDVLTLNNIDLSNMLKEEGILKQLTQSLMCLCQIFKLL